TGSFTGKDGFAEVIIEYHQPRYFSRIFGDSDTVVKARAVARGRWVSVKDGILVLDLTASESLKANGGGTVSVTNADIIVTSSDSSSVGGDGTGSTLKVTNGNFVLSGGVKSNTTLDGTVVKQTPPTPDPLAYLPQPSLPSTVLTVHGVQPNSQEGRG